MWARVLFVLLAAPACLGAAYSDYYDADGGNDEADFYDSYNDEIQAPNLIATVMDAVTRIKKRGLEDIRTLNPAEIIDVKGALHNILHRTIPEHAKGQQPVVRDYSDSYDYLENSNGIQKDAPVNVDRPNGNMLFKKWLPTFQIKNWSPTYDAHESMDYSSQPEQRSTYVYQPRAPSYSRKNEIIAQIRKMVPVFDGEVAAGSASVSVQPVDPAVDIQTSPIDVQNLHPAPDVKTLTTAADYSDSTQYNMMIQQESTLSNSEVQAEVRKLVPHWNLSSNVQRKSHHDNVPLWNISDSILNRKPPAEAQHWHPTTETPSWNISGNSLHRMPPGVAQLWSPKTEVPFWNISDNSPHRNSPDGAQHWSPNTEAPFWNLSDNILNRRPAGSAQHWNPTTVRHRPSNVQHWSPSDSVRHGNSTGDVEHWSTADDAQHQNATTDDETDHTGGVFRANKKKETTKAPYTGESTPTPKIDIDAILAILANLTYDYEWNLTEEFNKTLIDHGVPTCPWKNWVYEPWGPEGVYTASTTPTVPLYNFENASVVSKCFVCGLKTGEIPRDAYCADAFAGDFLPLMPVDPRSRGKIASYRKYCRYFDVHNWVEDASEPRAIYGRFTGGCAVRWTDITGIYTQRTCRSKYRPLMGRHFASKRMAKLELALVNVEDGCIISPMATLLPVSRGISLYARFHACVCSTNWCNRATHAHSSLHTIIFVLACWLAHYT